MTAGAAKSGMGWGARLLIALALILIGAAGATWGLARSKEAARLLGVTPPAAEIRANRAAGATAGGHTVIANAEPVPSGTVADAARIAQLEERLARVENASQQAAGSAGRADSLLIAVAARRAIDRGVALGFLERLLVERFGSSHERAVATVVTGAREPVLLNALIADYEMLGPELRRGGPDAGWWAGLKRELGSIITVHSAKRPSATPDVRYERALRRLQAGDVDQALTETMRMPGATRAGPWIEDARRYIAVHRALDEIEAAALMPPRGA